MLARSGDKTRPASVRKIGVYSDGTNALNLRSRGPVAQLIERVVRNDEVVGLIPIRSTKIRLARPSPVAVCAATSSRGAARQGENHGHGRRNRPSGSQHALESVREVSRLFATKKPTLASGLFLFRELREICPMPPRTGRSPFNRQ